MNPPGILPAALILLGVLGPASAAPAELSPEAERGKLIYLRGVSASGEEITALMGQPATEVPASVIPCGGCHGRDGRGRPEGGLSPSDLTWEALTKPYGVRHPGGREHPPYTERQLKRAITLGFDPAGNELHVGMPRYRLRHEDLADLVAYLRQLGEDPVPGVTGDAVRLLTLVPRDGPSASFGEALAAVLAARFDEVNRSGGIYGRRLELEVLPAPAGAAARAEVLRDSLESGTAFAVVGAFLAGAEDELTAVARDFETPLVGPFTLDPRIDFFDPNPWVFYVLPGPEDLSRVLMSFAAEDAGRRASAPRAALVTAGGMEPSHRTIAGHAAKLGWPEVLTGTYASLDVGSLAAAGVDTVFLLTSGEESRDVLRRAAALGWHPRVYLPGPLAGPELFEAPPGFAGRIFLAYPTLPLDRELRSARRYRDLAERHDLPPRHLAAQTATLAAAELLIEGLERAGRDLSRAGLLEAFEGFVEVETEVLPAVTWGPDRRLGIRGGYVVALDLDKRTLAPVSGWIEPW